MDVLFKNTYIQNKENAKELYSYFYFKKPTFVAIYVLLAITFILNLINAMIGGDFIVFCLVAPPLVVLFQLFRYFTSVNAATKRALETYGEYPTITVTVTDECIAIGPQGHSITNLQYESIKYAVQTKSHVMLFSKANLVYSLKIDGFEIGTKEDFIPFLLGKGIRVKGKRR